MNINKTTYSSIVVMACLLTVMAWTTTVHAAVIGYLRGVTGPVDMMRGGKLPSMPARNNDKVSTGDLLRTKTGGFAEVVYNDGTVLRISPRSRVDIGEHFSGKKPDGSEVRLARGKIQAIVDLKNAGSKTGTKKFEVRTPNAIAGVRGTNFTVSHDRSVTGIFVRSGSVYSYNVSNPARSVVLGPGTLTTITAHNPPAPPRTALRNEIQQMEHSTSPPAGGATSGGTTEAGGTTTAPTGGGTAGSGTTGTSTSSTSTSAVSPTGGTAEVLTAGSTIVSAPTGGTTTSSTISQVVSGGGQRVIQAQTVVATGTNSNATSDPIASAVSGSSITTAIIQQQTTITAPATTPLNVKVKVNFK